MNNKKEFIEPEIEIIETEDIITASQFGNSMSFLDEGDEDIWSL